MQGPDHGYAFFSSFIIFKRANKSTKKCNIFKIRQNTAGNMKKYI